MKKVKCGTKAVEVFCGEEAVGNVFGAQQPKRVPLQGFTEALAGNCHAVRAH